MTLTIAYDGAPLGFDVPPTKVSMPSRAELGNVSTGGFSPEDPAAALEMVGWRSVAIDETACTTQPRLFTGYIADRDIGRSFDQTQFIGDDPRIHDTTILDLNACLGLRIITGADAKRGVESLSDRVAWILGSVYLAGLVSDTGKIQDFGAMDPMDATDYRGRYASDVLADCNDRSGGILNYFVFWDPAPTLTWPSTTPDPPARPGLFFDSWDESVTTACTIKISNAGDANGTTIFEPTHDARLKRTPEAVYSDVKVDYANGSVYRSLASTETAHIKRGTTISRPHTGGAATAIAQGDAWLGVHAAEMDRITCTIHVPSSVVGLLWAGQRMQVKFTHLTDYTSDTWVRIVASSPKASDDLARFYDVDLELVGARVAAPGPVCSYVYGGGGYSPSSKDAFGATVDGIVQYYPSSPVYPSTTQDVVGFPVYGTPNDGGAWGIIAGVGSGITSARWVWDLGVPTAMCAYGYNVYSGIFGQASIEWSDDGTNWTTIVEAPLINLSQGIALPTPYVPHRYWGLHFWVDTSYGYFPGTDIRYFMLWAASVPGPTGGIIPTLSDTQTTTDPTVTDDIDAGYSVGSTWINTTSGNAFILVDNTTGAAVWQSTTVAGSAQAANTILAGPVSGAAAEPEFRALVAADIPAGIGGGVTVEDEGTPLATVADTLNFVGAGVVASGSGTTKTITVSGASVSEITDIPTAETDTALVLKPDGAGGVAWGTGGGGGGGLYEDAFTSLAGWTVLGTLDTSNVSDAAGYWHVIRACSSEIDGIYQAVPATPFTITMKVSAFALAGSAHPSLGIMLLDATPTAIREFSFNFASGTQWTVSLRRYTDRTSFSSSVDVAMGAPLVPWIYLRLLVTSSSSVTFSYSWNGLIWITPASLSAIDPTLTPAYWGLLVSDPVSASSPEMFSRLPVVS